MPKKKGKQQAKQTEKKEISDSARLALYAIFVDFVWLKRLRCRSGLCARCFKPASKACSKCKVAFYWFERFSRFFCFSHSISCLFVRFVLYTPAHTHAQLTRMSNQRLDAWTQNCMRFVFLFCAVWFVFLCWMCVFSVVARKRRRKTVKQQQQQQARQKQQPIPFRLSLLRCLIVRVHKQHKPNNAYTVCLIVWSFRARQQSWEWADTTRQIPVWSGSCACAVQINQHGAFVCCLFVYTRTKAQNTPVNT